MTGPEPFERAVELGRKLGGHGGDGRFEQARADQGAARHLERNTAAYFRARFERDEG
jgi:hypothetical protein